MTPTKLTALLDQFISGLGDEVVEFETASTQYSAHKTGKYVSAIANEANVSGLPVTRLVLGIDSDQNVVGTAGLTTSQNRQSLKHHVQHPIDHELTLREVSEVEHSVRRVVLAAIPTASTGIPTSSKGGPLTRLQKPGAMETVRVTHAARWQLNSTETTVE